MDNDTREKLEAAYDFCDASIVILEKVNVTETNSVLTLLKYQRRILDTVLFPEKNEIMTIYINIVLIDYRVKPDNDNFSFVTIVKTKC